MVSSEQCPVKHIVVEVYTREHMLFCCEILLLCDGTASTQLVYCYIYCNPSNATHIIAYVVTKPREPCMHICVRNNQIHLTLMLLVAYLALTK